MASMLVLLAVRCYADHLGFDTRQLIMSTSLFVQHATAADLSGDGLLDVVVSIYYGNRVAVYVNLGSGMFSPAILMTGTCEGARHLVVARLNADSALDVVAGCTEQTRVIALVSAANATVWTQTASIESSYAGGAFDVGLLSDDSINDIFVANTASVSLAYAPGLGNGSFGQLVTIAPMLAGSSTFFTDLDGDTLGDLLELSTGAKTLRVAWRASPSTFDVPLLVANNIGSSSTAFAAADFDADGDVDVVAAGVTLRTVVMLRNLGARVFAAPVTVFSSVSTSMNVWSFAVGDLNQDGVLDLGVQGEVTNCKSFVLFGSAILPGTFTSDVLPVTCTNGRTMMFADITADGFTDVLLGFLTPGETSLLRSLNVCPPLDAGNATVRAITTRVDAPVLVGTRGAPARVNETREVVCNAGYVLSAGVVNRTCLVGGSYSGTAWRCDPVPCSMLAAPLNGLVVGGLVVGVFGDTRTIACNAAFALVGPTSVSCMANGTWGPVPSCVAIPSPPPPPPPPPSPPSPPPPPPPPPPSPPPLTGGCAESCLNGASCIDARCVCVNGFSGARCERAPLPALTDVEPRTVPFNRSDTRVVLFGSYLTPLVSLLLDHTPIGLGAIEQGPAEPPSTALHQLVFTSPAFTSYGYKSVIVQTVHGAAEVSTLFFVDSCLEASYRVGDACLACPTGARCPGGARLWPLPGYWNPDENAGYVSPCQPPAVERCPGVTSASSARCGAGYTGTECLSCAADYYADGTRCVACGSSHVRVIVILFDALFFTAYIVLAFFGSSLMLERYAFGMVMVQSARTSLLSLRWAVPSWLSWLNHAFAAVSHDSSSARPECYGQRGSAFIGKFWGNVGTLTATLVVMLLGFALRSAYVRFVRKFPAPDVASTEAAGAPTMTLSSLPLSQPSSCSSSSSLSSSSTLAAARARDALPTAHTAPAPSSAQTAPLSTQPAPRGRNARSSYRRGRAPALRRSVSTQPPTDSLSRTAAAETLAESRHGRSSQRLVPNASVERGPRLAKSASALNLDASTGGEESWAARVAEPSAQRRAALAPLRSVTKARLLRSHNSVAPLIGRTSDVSEQDEDASAGSGASSGADAGVGSRVPSGDVTAISDESEASTAMARPSLSRALAATNERRLRSVSILVYAMYATLATSAFSVLFCVRQRGALVLSVEPEVVCFSSEHMIPFVLAGLLLLGVLVPLPVGLWVFLARLHARRLETDAHWVSALGALFVEYRRKWFMVSSLWMLFLGAQSGVSVFLARAPLAQTLVGIAVCLPMIVLFGLVQPYRFALKGIIPLGVILFSGYAHVVNGLALVDGLDRTARLALTLASFFVLFCVPLAVVLARSMRQCCCARAKVSTDPLVVEQDSLAMDAS